MFRPRIIPVLLLQGTTLVKTEAFTNPTYIGDPINAVKIYNELLADELVFLDINATKENRIADLQLVKSVSEEANMPFSIGGGIKTTDQIRSLLSAGAEKVIIGSEACLRPEFIKEASETFGSSTITVCIDISSNIFGKESVYIQNGRKKTNFNPLEFAQQMESMGAGELILQSVKRDGTRIGYAKEIIQKIADSTTIPTVALGGASSVEEMLQFYLETNISGLGAGSIFVYQGKRKGVLINYPEKKEIRKLIMDNKFN